MPVFAVIAGSNSSHPLKPLVEKAYIESARVSIDNGNYFVFDDGLLTPKEVCDKIIGANNTTLRLLVMPVESYWGVHDGSVWAWLGSKKL